MRILTRLPITFEVAGGETSHAPMIIGSVNGAEARLVLDTGSDVHLLTVDFADRLGLQKEPGEEGTDHSGASMPSWSVGEVTLSLGDLDVALRGVVAIPAPPPFPVRGIVGILSPQHLHPTAMTVIDMDSYELLLLEGADDSIAEFLRERSPRLLALQLRRDPEFLSIVVGAAISPYAEIPAMLNTGGRRTEFSSAAMPGLVAGQSERLGGGVSGADVVGSRVGPETLVVEGHRIPVASLAIRAEMHDPQGLIGMDLLRGTVLTCAAELHRPVFWQISTAPN